MGTTLHGSSGFELGEPRAMAPARMIVAEDEPDIRQLVSVAFRGLGYVVTEACTGAELLEHLSAALLDDDWNSRPDVIISDIRMPGVTGLEILEGLRDSAWSTSVVLMTAFSDAETRAEAVRLGADAFFEKPFDIDDMMTAVVNLSPATRALRDRRRH